MQRPVWVATALITPERQPATAFRTTALRIRLCRSVSIRITCKTIPSSTLQDRFIPTSASRLRALRSSTMGPSTCTITLPSPRQCLGPTTILFPGPAILRMHLPHSLANTMKSCTLIATSPWMPGITAAYRFLPVGRLISEALCNPIMRSMPMMDRCTGP